MITDQKRIIDMGLSTATLVSFAFPGGVVVAGAIGTAQLLFDIFAPGAPIDPNAAPPSIADLNDAMDTLAAKVDEDLWQKDISVLQQEMLTQNDIFMMFWDWMSLVKLQKLVVEDTGANDGATYVADSADNDLVDNLETYFKVVGGPFARLLTAIGVLSNPADKNSTASQLLHRKTQNTALYCLVASTFIAYCKAWIIWDWGHNHVLKYNAYVAYDKLNRRYQGGTSAYRQNHSQPISPLKAGENAPTEPDWNEWSKSGPVQEMLKVIDKILLYAEGTAASPGLYTTMVKNWYTDRPKTVADRLSKLSIQSGNSKYWYLDSETNETSPKVDNRQFAELHMEGKAGSLIAYYWDHWSDTYGLDGVTEDAITTFGDSIKLWKQTRASVNFKRYTVAKGDTLSSIATKAKFPVNGKSTLWYPSALYNKAIFDANKPNLAVSPYVPGGPTTEWERVTLTEGQVLTLPDPAAAGFTLYTVTKADAYPYTICEKFFHNRNLRGPLDEANSDIMDPTAPGVEIRIPIL